MADTWYVYNARCCGYGIVRNPNGWNEKGHEVGGDWVATLMVSNGEYFNTLGNFIEASMDLASIPLGNHVRIDPPRIRVERKGEKVWK